MLGLLQLPPMPNGGSDCCGTCWFNRKNRGERDWHRHADNTLPDHCEIRDLAIEDPFYTYCANHPHRRPERDCIPIGPVTRHGGWKEDQPEFEYPRYAWKPSPDNEEVRQHLLSLLDSIFEHMLDDQYPIGNRLGELVVWQLGEFPEQRAVERLTELSEDRLGILVDAANEALAKIRGSD